MVKPFVSEAPDPAEDAPKKKKDDDDDEDMLQKIRMPTEKKIALDAEPTEVEIALAAAEEHRRKVLERCMALHMLHGRGPPKAK